VVGAEEGDHLAPGDVLDAGGELVAHGLLVGTAGLEHEIAPAVADEAVLPFGHEVLDDDRDEVVVEVRSGLRRAAAGVLAEEAHDEVADGEAVRASGCRVESGAGQASSVLASLRCRIAREKEGDAEVRRATGLVRAALGPYALSVLPIDACA